MGFQAGPRWVSACFDTRPAGAAQHDVEFGLPRRRHPEPTAQRARRRTHQAMTATTLPSEVLERRARAQEWFESLRERIMTALEAIEDEASADLFPGESGRFERKPWARD